ncbi:MAG TPA: small, acid-soluble spore protein, alpha/beta type [Firmicutes bacterium]|nr:small, acid-soluble spore protein, alpha/beta type [Bacillota bacterium]
MLLGEVRPVSLRDREERAKEKLKLEVAEDLGLADDLQDPDELSVREAGKIGGNMVKRLVEKGEERLAAEQSATGVPGGPEGQDKKA